MGACEAVEQYTEPGTFQCSIIEADKLDILLGGAISAVHCTYTTVLRYSNTISAPTIPLTRNGSSWPFP